MTIGVLDASNFEYSSVFYSAEFEDILSRIIACYNLMLSDKVQLYNDENKIRDVLYINYLNNDNIRKSIGLLSYYIDRETQEDRTAGRTDIRILTKNSFETTAAYYIIECKRLDAINTTGSSGLNSKYIENGVCRFVCGTYSTFYKTNGMIGFIVQPLKVIDNISHLNILLGSFPQTNTTQNLTYKKIVDNFDFSYCSVHNRNNDAVTLYHLMFDFSGNVCLA